MKEKDFNRLIEDIDDLIIKAYEKWGGYNTEDLNDIIVALIENHAFSSKDSVQNLIYELENIIEEEEV